MLTIINNNLDPRFNLALEEYVLKYLNITEDFLLIWQNSKCVIIGRNQNPFSDINGAFVNKNHFPIFRRTTNERAIYHDLGSVNYAIVSAYSKAKENDPTILLSPVINALHTIGINVTMKKDYQLYVGKDRIATTYQNVFKDKIIHHGIFYVETNLSYLKLVHNQKTTDLVNLKKFFKQQMTVSMFKLLFLHDILDGEVSKKVYHLDRIDLKRINQLIGKKYNNWDWNYGESKEFIIKKEFENRMLITLIIKRGFIRDVTVDSFKENNIKLEKALLDIRFDEENLKKVLSDFKNIDADKFIDKIMY